MSEKTYQDILIRIPHTTYLKMKRLSGVHRPDLNFATMSELVREGIHRVLEDYPNE